MESKHNVLLKTFKETYRHLSWLAFYMIAFLFHTSALNAVEWHISNWGIESTIR